MSSEWNLYPAALDNEQQEIRLITLHPGVGKEPLYGNLFSALVTDRPLYTALSYVWGEAVAAEGIIIDGIRHAITKNLQVALRYIRHRSETRSLWIDAVCINQHDVDERNHQVSKMSDIFSTASSVLIWLGEGDTLSRFAFKWMGWIANGSSSIPEDARQKMYRFYEDITSRPWFSRVWVIQEMALAKQDPVVMCGYDTVPWSVFTGAWTALAPKFYEDWGTTRTKTGDGQDEDETVEVMAKRNFDILDDLRKSVQSHGGEDLSALLLVSHISEATDDKDQIYALLGLLRQDDWWAFAFDYRKPTSRIFAEAVAHIFAKGRGPHFLSSTVLHSGTSRIVDLPSWVPDFTAQGSQIGLEFHPPHPMTASGSLMSQTNGKIFEDFKTMEISTLLVDVVEETIALPQTLDRCLEQLLAIDELARQNRAKHLRPSEKYVVQREQSDRVPISSTNSLQAEPDPQLTLDGLRDNLKAKEPVWRTLISNTKYSSWYDTAPETYGDMYHVLVSALRERGSLDQSIREQSKAYLQSLDSHIPGRTFFTTKHSFLGVGMPGVRPGDRATIWFGSDVPFIVRPTSVGEQTESYTLVGAAYIGGIMKGELVDEALPLGLMDAKPLFIR